MKKVYNETYRTREKISDFRGSAYEKTYIAIAGAMVVAIGLGVGVTASKTYAKGSNNVAAVQKITDNKDSSNQIAGNENNGTVDTKETINAVENKDSVDSQNTTTGNINKNNVDNTKAVNENKNTVSENKDKKPVESSKEDSSSNVQIKEESNSIYKDGVTAADIKKVKDNYDKDTDKIVHDFGSHFRKTGELVFSGEEGDNDRVKLFYDESDATLNNIWNGLQSILSKNEMQKLTTSQKQWIKERREHKGRW